MTRENSFCAYFSLFGDFDPAEITAQIGVQPTEQWKVGQLHPRTLLERKFSRWSLHSRLPESDALEDHVRDVLAQLDARPEAFQTASRAHGGCLQLVGYFFLDYPGLTFDRATTEGLARYGLEVDFDFYGLYSSRREDTG